MSRHQLIEAIRQQNPGADTAFLETFNDAALHHYLDRLEYRQAPRRDKLMWVRQPETPAIVASAY